MVSLTLIEISSMRTPCTRGISIKLSASTSAYDKNAVLSWLRYLFWITLFVEKAVPSLPKLFQSIYASNFRCKRRRHWSQISILIEKIRFTHSTFLHDNGLWHSLFAKTYGNLILEPSIDLGKVTSCRIVG